MSKLQRLRALLKQRLDAEDEIFELFERTIADFEEELTRLKENERRYKLLDAVFSPKVHLHSLVFPANVQQLLVIKEEDPPQWSPNLEQKHPEPLHIKEEQDEVWTSQEGEQLNRLEEPDITRFPSTAVPVKSEDEEKPQSSQLHQSQTEDNREAEPPVSSSATQIKTESGGKDCGGSEPARNQDPDGHSQLSTDEKASEIEVKNEDRQESLADSGPESEVSDSGWKEARESESDVNTLEGSQTVHTEEKQFGCDVCGKIFKYKQNLKAHMGLHTGGKQVGCDVCGQQFRRNETLRKHMRIHTGEKPFTCGVCGKRFTQEENLRGHMMNHTGEKQFSCAICGKRFTCKRYLMNHMRVHTEEKPFGCDVCGQRFRYKANMKEHMGLHTGEKQFACDVCGKRLKYERSLKKHMRDHSEEKLCGCSDFGKRLTQHETLKNHTIVHTEEKPFGCVFCGKTFKYKGNLKVHIGLHTGEKQFGCDVCGK
ncbi:zinc finger protein OZF-like isoform X2 [Pempheris klunzingeri]|uniref:zinc finger protein OZF-like isoform X2 n=1 Tax=Pempheris klunzingeri TaxID=3127111 RepID=UPI003980758D